MRRTLQKRRVSRAPSTWVNPGSKSISDMVADPAIDAIWLCGPNHTRVENVEEITTTLQRGRGSLKGIACEKPLARNVGEARRIVELVEQAGLRHGYLENQIFAPSIATGREIVWTRGVPATGRPYLARAAEEHSGPHKPWFWRGDLQGGGVLNDMMCHSVMLVRHLLTSPGSLYSSVQPVGFQDRSQVLNGRCRNMRSVLKRSWATV